MHLQLIPHACASRHFNAVRRFSGRALKHWVASAILMVVLAQPGPAGAQRSGLPTPGLPWLPAAPAAFQQQSAEDTVQTLTQAALFSVRAEEMRIEGTVRTINSSHRRFVLETDLMVLRPESSGDLNSLPARTILVDRSTVLWMPAGAGTFDFTLLSRGQEAIVIGEASPDGRFVRARLVALLRDVVPNTPLRHAKAKPMAAKARATTALTTKKRPSAQLLAAAPKVLSRRVQAPPHITKIVPQKTPAAARRASIVTKPAKSNTSKPVGQGVVSQAPWLSSSRSSQRLPDTDSSQALTQANAAARLQPRLSRATPLPSTTLAIPRHEDSKLSAIPAPMTELAPRPQTSTALAERDDSGQVARAGDAARLKAPAPIAPLAPPQATMKIGEIPATRAVPLPRPTDMERAPVTLAQTLSQPRLVQSAPPRVSSPTPASPIGRLATSALSPDLPETLSEPPLDEGARVMVPPLRAHPDSDRARRQAARDFAQRTQEMTARYKFQASREAQRDIRFSYFNGLISDSPTILSAANDEKLVALTFDDGPHPSGTVAVLDVLKREHVPATFFVVGRNVEKHPELVLRAVAEGHEIANHTQHHLQRASMSVADWTQEIDRNNRVIAGVLGGAPRWFRAPGCRYSFAALQAIDELGMIRVDTTNNSGDWEQPNPDVIVHRVLSRLAPGQVLLFHDPAPQTARALPQLIAELKRRGYRCVSLTELAQRAQATPGFKPLWCPPGQGIVVATRAPGSTATNTIANNEALPDADNHSPDAPLQIGATP